MGKQIQFWCPFLNVPYNFDNPFFFFPELFPQADLILPADSWICNMLALCHGEFFVMTGWFQLVRDTKT